MKRTLLGAIAALVLGAAAMPANALQYGEVPPRERDRDIPIVYGVFKATVKRIAPHQGPDGTYHTYVYHYVTAQTMQSCMQQLQSMLASPGVTVVQYCHEVP